MPTEFFGINPRARGRSSRRGTVGAKSGASRPPDIVQKRDPLPGRSATSVQHSIQPGATRSKSADQLQQYHQRPAHAAHISTSAPAPEPTLAPPTPVNAHSNVLSSNASDNPIHSRCSGFSSNSLIPTYTVGLTQTESTFKPDPSPFLYSNGRGKDDDAYYVPSPTVVSTSTQTIPRRTRAPTFSHTQSIQSRHYPPSPAFNPGYAPASPNNTVGSTTAPPTPAYVAPSELRSAPTRGPHPVIGSVGDGEQHPIISVPTSPYKAPPSGHDRGNFDVPRVSSSTYIQSRRKGRSLDVPRQRLESAPAPPLPLRNYKQVHTPATSNFTQFSEPVFSRIITNDSTLAQNRPALLFPETDPFPRSAPMTVPKGEKTSVSAVPVRQQDAVSSSGTGLSDVPGPTIQQREAASNGLLQLPQSSTTPYPTRNNRHTEQSAVYSQLPPSPGILRSSPLRSPKESTSASSSAASPSLRGRCSEPALRTASVPFPKAKVTFSADKPVRTPKPATFDGQEVSEAVKCTGQLGSGSSGSQEDITMDVRTIIAGQRRAMIESIESLEQDIHCTPMLSGLRGIPSLQHAHVHSTSAMDSYAPQFNKVPSDSTPTSTSAASQSVSHAKGSNDVDQLLHDLSSMVSEPSDGELEGVLRTSVVDELMIAFDGTNPCRKASSPSIDRDNKCPNTLVSPEPDASPQYEERFDSVMQELFKPHDDDSKQVTRRKGRARIFDHLAHHGEQEFVGALDTQGTHPICKATASTLENNMILRPSSQSRSWERSASKSKAHIGHPQLDTVDPGYRHAHLWNHDISHMGPTFSERSSTSRDEDRNGDTQSKKPSKGSERRSRSRSRLRTRRHKETEDGPFVSPTESDQLSKEPAPIFQRSTEEKRYYSYPQPGARKLPGINAYEVIERATYSDALPIALITTSSRILSTLLSHLNVIEVKSLTHVCKPLREKLTGSQGNAMIVNRFLGRVGYRGWEESSTASGVSAHLGRDQLDDKDLVPLKFQDIEGFVVSHDFLREYKIASLKYLSAGCDFDGRIPRLARATTCAYNRVLAWLRAQPPSVDLDPQQSSANSSSKLLQHHATTCLSGIAELTKAEAELWTHSEVPSPHKASRAACFRVWVPGKDTVNAWLSDSEVTECEQELFKSGIWKYLRPGDVVWDTALGQEQNQGKFVFDGRFLRDLSYAYDPIGHLPSWLNSFTFPPSYFHNIIAASAQPVIYLDILPFRQAIFNSLELVTANLLVGIQHVSRWVYRATIPIDPSREEEGGRYVHKGWAGQVVVEVDGSLQGVQDLL